MVDKPLTGAGLRGQVAGKTAVSTVGKSGSGLTYRGYDVSDLAANCEFEEVAYLLRLKNTKRCLKPSATCQPHSKQCWSRFRQAPTPWM